MVSSNTSNNTLVPPSPVHIPPTIPYLPLKLVLRYCFEVSGSYTYRPHKINILERMIIPSPERGETLVRLDSNLCVNCALVLVRWKVADMWADWVDRLKVINGTLPLSSSEPPLPSLHGMPPKGGL